MSRFPRVEGVVNEHKVIHIYTEGTRTEPLYFRAVRDEVHSRNTNININVVGLRRQTLSLVDYVLERVDAERIVLGAENDQVWVVFDRDDETDFGNAIEKALARGLRVAYSNESFELWYYLHFHLLDTDIGRDAYIKKLESFISKETGKKFEYDKAKSIYNLIRNKQKVAIRNAKTLEKGCEDETNFFKKCPSTTVHHLVEELNSLV